MQVQCTDFYGKTHLVDVNDLIDRLSAYGAYATNGKVLLIQDPRSLRWELPGGGVEKGETIRQGLSREFAEEAGVSIAGPLKLLTEWTEYFFDVPTGQAWRSKRKFYIIRKIEGELLTAGNGDDSATAKLVPKRDFQSLNLTPKIREVLELLTSR